MAAFERGNFAIAVRLFRPLAEQGNADAQTKLGFMYSEGQGVPRDYAEAVRWFREAARQRDVDARKNFGVMYSKGQVVYHWTTRKRCAGITRLRHRGMLSLSTTSTSSTTMARMCQGTALQSINSGIWLSQQAIPMPIIIVPLWPGR